MESPVKSRIRDNTFYLLQLSLKRNLREAAQPLAGRSAGNGAVMPIKEFVRAAGSGSGAFKERESVDLEFDRVLGIITGGATRYQGLTPEEIGALIRVLEEKRTEFKARGEGIPGYGSRYSGRVQTMLIADPRAKAVFDARMQRRKTGPDGPIRYLGFQTTTSARIFNFGRLPARDEGDVFEVRIAHAFFGPHQLSLQEGPGFCAAILAEKDQPAEYEATASDVQEFLAKKPSKAKR